MKELTKYNRVAGYLNKLYDMLNVDFFDGALERPVITIQSTPRAYGHFTLYNAWSVNGQGVPEINLGAGTLDRPIENIITTLLHEMLHQHNAINNIQDVSRNGTYHNKTFKKSAEARGLIVSQSLLYGWNVTEPADRLLQWVLDNDLSDIKLSRNEFYMRIDGSGQTDGDAGKNKPTKKGSYRKHTCPDCGLTARTTREASLICGDCQTEMIQE